MFLMFLLVNSVSNLLVFASTSITTTGLIEAKPQRFQLNVFFLHPTTWLLFVLIMSASLEKNAFLVWAQVGGRRGESKDSYWLGSKMVGLRRFAYSCCRDEVGRRWDYVKSVSWIILEARGLGFLNRAQGGGRRTRRADSNRLGNDNLSLCLQFAMGDYSHVFCFIFV